jgi:hypothetical protein
VLLYGYNLNIYPSFPWVRTGANLATTALMHTIVKWQTDLQHLQQDLPRVLHILADGGSENVNKTMLMLYAWLVSHGVFEEIHVHRLPVGHTHSILDQRFSVIAQFLLGPAGKDALTVDKMLARIKEAFSGEYNRLAALDKTGGQLQRDDYIVQGGEPVVQVMQCTHDYTAFFKEVENPNLKGFGSGKRLLRNLEGVIELSEVAASEVMYMKFSCVEKGDSHGVGRSVAQMQYKTAAQYKEYLPGMTEFIDVFSPHVHEVSDLPLLSREPPLARFHFPAKKIKANDVTKGKKAVSKLVAVAHAILSIPRTHLPEEDYLWWVEHIATWPKVPDDVEKVASKERPQFGPKPRNLVYALNREPTVGSCASASYVDPPPKPLAPSVTDSHFANGDKKKLVKALLEGTSLISLIT